MSARVSLRGMLKLIRVDTLRRVHNVGILEERLICGTIYAHVYILINIVIVRFGIFLQTMLPPVCCSDRASTSGAGGRGFDHRSGHTNDF